MINSMPTAIHWKVRCTQNFAIVETKVQHFDPDHMSLITCLIRGGTMGLPSQGCSGAGLGGTVSPTFFKRGTHPHFLHFFGPKFVQKLVHCCNRLLTETQCKTVSVQHVCRPKLFKNLCLSLVSGVRHFFFRTTPLEHRLVYLAVCRDFHAGIRTEHTEG